MLKKILFISLLCCTLTIPCLATNWQKVDAPSRQKNVASVFLDMDSIHKNSYVAVVNAKYIYTDKHYALATLAVTNTKGIKPLSFIECSPDGYLMRTLSYNSKYFPIKNSSLTEKIYEILFET